MRTRRETLSETDSLDTDMRRRWLQFLRGERIIIRLQKSKYLSNREATQWLEDYDARCQHYITQFQQEIDQLEQS